MDSESSTVGERPEITARIARGIPPMRRLFPGNLLDRKLLRPVVQAFANVKDVDYEAAHAYLYARAEKIGFEAPDVTPDYLCTRQFVENRRRIAKEIATKRLLRERFICDDGKGETADPVNLPRPGAPDLTEHQLARSQRGGV